MNYEESIETIKIAKAEVEWNYPLDYQIAFDVAIDCIEKQSDIIHCIDCDKWDIHHTITGFKGTTSHIGQCKLTGWLCGELGYCMYGNRRQLSDE